MDHKTKASARLAQASCNTRTSVDTTALLALYVASVCALLAFAIPAFAQSALPPIPENASAKSYGDGWECKVGYRLQGDICAAIEVPENAYKTNRTYGPGWACYHGFRASADTICVAVAVPDGGFLDPSGQRWHCLRGYLKVNDTCQKIDLPANAFLVDAVYGSSWECERGFEAQGDLCVAIVVPANGYLNTSSFGTPWTCERGYFAKADRCEAVFVPENAYFDDTTYGNGWKCERGYAASGNDCKAIDIPANAHLDRSGNLWECNRNFQKSKGQCVLRN